MTDITREAVEARIALLRSDYAADGAAFDADMLLALLARAETAERERDALIKDASAKDEDGSFWYREILKSQGQLVAERDAAEAERDRLAGELAEARKTIEGMRELLTEVAEVEIFDAMMSGPVRKGFNHSALVRVMPKVRAALAQTNKTEGV